MPLSKHTAKENTFPGRGSDREFWNIIEGKVQIISDDYWGERQILAGFGKGQLFGEAYHVWRKCLSWSVR